MSARTVPDDAASLLKLGADEEREGRVLRAQVLYRHGVQRHPQSAELRSALARVQARIDEGIKSGAVHVDRGPQPPTQDPEVLFRQAEVYVKYGLTAKALEQLQQLLAIAPHHAAGKALLETLRADAGH